MKHFYLGTVLANPFITSVSAGAANGSVPSGQSDPAVTPDLAPAESSSDGGVEGHAYKPKGYGIQAANEASRETESGGQTNLHRVGIESGPSEANGGAPQPRGEAAHTNATQPVTSPNFDSVIKELLQICPPLKLWQTPLRIDARHQERAVDDAIADFFDPAPMFLKEPLRRAG